MEGGEWGVEGEEGRRRWCSSIKFKENFLSTTFHPQCCEPALPLSLSAGAGSKCWYAPYLLVRNEQHVLLRRIYSAAWELDESGDWNGRGGGRENGEAEGERKDYRGA
jgi:hypothetical protein